MKKKIILITTLFITILCHSQNLITLEDIWIDYKFYPKSVSGFKSMQNGDYYTTISKKGNKVKINQHSFETGEIVKILMNTNDDKLKNIKRYQFNNDESKILIATNTESIYRYSSKSLYYIYNIKTKRLKEVNTNKIMYATFSPDGNNIAYVYENNLYIYNLNWNKTTKVTDDGEKNKIINGASDWVYEEEFGLVRSFEWSDDSKHIAYYKFDETNVKEFSMDLFKEGLYPTQEVFKYPKAGEENSKVTLHLYNLEDKSKIKINTNKKHEYIPRIKWFDNEDPRLVVYGMNRHQNTLDFIIVDRHGKQKTLFTEQDKYYIDVHDNLTYLPKQSSFIWTSEKDGFNHIYLKNLNGKETQITYGNWEVTKFYGIDDEDNIYYSSNETGSIHNAMYKMNLDSKNGKGILMTEATGTNYITISKGMKY